MTTLVCISTEAIVKTMGVGVEWSHDAEVCHRRMEELIDQLINRGYELTNSDYWHAWLFDRRNQEWVYMEITTATRADFNM